MRKRIIHEYMVDKQVLYHKMIIHLSNKTKGPNKIIKVHANGTFSLLCK
jgi:hypothetical protein